jgi:glyoxylase-like metal-dependent hydrolase (beta-lactamase superfamily II)
VALATWIGGCSEGNAPPAETATGAVELYAMNCGRFLDSDQAAYSDDGAYDGRSGEMADPCYLIRHPRGDLLWDLGLPESTADAPDGLPDPFGPSRMFVAKKLTAQLAELGLTPADIEFISVSHSHFDHIGNGNLFADTSTWIVDTDEHHYAFSDAARDQPGFSEYSRLETATTVLIDGNGNYDVFGDGSVTIVQAPGHTPGHAVLLVRLAEAGPILLTGDLWHIAESRPAKRVPVFNTDKAQTLQSMEKIEALARSTGARVVLQHVVEDFAAMPQFPLPLK